MQCVAYKVSRCKRKPSLIHGADSSDNEGAIARLAHVRWQTVMPFLHRGRCPKDRDVMHRKKNGAILQVIIRTSFEISASSFD